MFKSFRNTLDRILANRRQKSTASAKECALTRGLRYEPLEARRMLATINVTTNIDLPVSENDGIVSIRDAVAYVNGTAAPGTLDRAAGGIVGTFGINDTIRFSALGGQPLLFSGGILNLFKPATIDGSTSGGGRVVFTGGNNQSSVGLVYDGDGTGRRLIVTDVEFRNFAITPAITIRSLGLGDSVRIVSSKFTGIGVAGSSEVAAIDIRDDFKGQAGILEIEGNEIHGNDHGIIYDDKTPGTAGTSPAVSSIFGNQFQNAEGNAGTSGNLNESIVLGDNVNRLLIRDNDFFSDGVAIEIDQPNLTMNEFVIIDGDNSFGTDLVPEAGVDLPFISDNRPVRVRAPEIQETLSEQLSGTSWSVEYFQENTANAGLDLEVEFYHYNSGTKRWRKVAGDNLSSGIFPQSGYVFEEVTLSSGLLSPGDFIAAKTIDDESLVNGSAFGKVVVLDEIAPQIVDIKLRGSSWDSQTPSYSFRDAVFQGNQLLPVWYSGIDTIDVVFSGPVSGGNTSIFLTGSDGDLPGFATRTPDPDSNPRTWDYRFEYGGGFTLDSDKYRVSNRTISGTRGALTNSPDGSKRLNGEWANPTTPDDLSDDPAGITFITGDANADGDFRFHFAVLPGDYNGDGIVEHGNEGTPLDATGDGIPDVDFGIDGDALPLRAVGNADFDDDEIVDLDDYDNWWQNFPYAPPPAVDPHLGDANGDGDIDASDFLIWQQFVAKTSAWYVTPVGGVPAFIENAFPVITNITFSGSNSTDAPYALGSMLGTGEQLRTIPVSGADTVSIQFNEGINTRPNRLQVINLDGTAPANVIDFDYDNYSQTATWTFDSAFTDGRHLFTFSNIFGDLEGDLLDPEIDNPWSLSDTSAALVESGDGNEGGDFRFRATILANDTDRDNIDGATDYTDWLSVEPGMILVSTEDDEVDSDLSIGDLSLREAIIQANLATEPTTIVLPTGRYVLDRIGTEASDSTYNDLDITSDITITGDGAGFTVVDSSGLSSMSNQLYNRAFHVDGAGTRLALDGITLTGGDSGAALSGTAVLAQDEAVLEITNSAVVNNSGYGDGVAIRSQGSDVTIRRSVFTNNVSTDNDAAVFATKLSGGRNGSVTIGQSIFALNQANNGTVTPNVWVANGVVKTSEGYNLYDEASGNFFNQVGQSTDYLGTPDYIVTTVEDTFDHTDDVEALSLREAIDLANTNSGAEEVWLPAWNFELTRDRGTNVYDTDISYGDLDITDTLTIRGVSSANGSATSIAWKSGVVDDIFDLLGDADNDGQANQGVSGSDYLAWQQQNGSGSQDSSNWGQHSADFDDDGDVDSDDLAIWSAYNGNTLDLFDILT